MNDSVNNRKLLDYLNDTIPVLEEWREMEQFAKENNVPIMDPISMHFLLHILKIHQPDQVLEIGTAIGYSACRIAKTLPDVTLTTIEKNPQMVQLATENRNTLHLQDQITVIQGDASDVMERMTETNELYDCIFIDAAKGQYKRFFQLADQLLRSNGIIVCDNVLFRGLVVQPELTEIPRLKKMASKLRDFNEELTRNEKYETSIVPIGDGVSISLKTE